MNFLYLAPSGPIVVSTIVGRPVLSLIEDEGIAKVLLIMIR